MGKRITSISAHIKNHPRLFLTYETMAAILHVECARKLTGTVTGRKDICVVNGLLLGYFPGTSVSPDAVDVGQKRLIKRMGRKGGAVSNNN